MLVQKRSWFCSLKEASKHRICWRFLFLFFWLCKPCCLVQPRPPQEPAPDPLPFRQGLGFVHARRLDSTLSGSAGGCEGLEKTRTERSTLFRKTSQDWTVWETWFWCVLHPVDRIAGLLAKIFVCTSKTVASGEDF